MTKTDYSPDVHSWSRMEGDKMEVENKQIIHVEVHIKSTR